MDVQRKSDDGAEATPMVEVSGVLEFEGYPVSGGKGEVQVARALVGTFHDCAWHNAEVHAARL